MTIKFQRQPKLVQIEVIKSLEYADIFCLSLTSTRTANVARCVKFKNVTKLFYIHHHDQFNAHVEEHPYDGQIPVGSAKTKRTRNFKYLFKTRLGTSEMNFDCQKVDDRYRSFKTVLFYRSDPEKLVPRAMIEHAVSLFGTRPPVFLFVIFDASFDDTPTVPSVTEMHSKSKKISAKCVRFLKNNPNLKCLVIKGEWTVELYFPEIPYLKILNSDQYAGAILRSFEGQHLVLQTAELGTREILDFVKNGNPMRDSTILSVLKQS